MVILRARFVAVVSGHRDSESNDVTGTAGSRPRSVNLACAAVFGVSSSLPTFLFPPSFFINYMPDQLHVLNHTSIQGASMAHVLFHFFYFCLLADTCFTY